MIGHMVVLHGDTWLASGRIVRKLRKLKPREANISRSWEFKESRSRGKSNPRKLGD